MSSLVERLIAIAQAEGQSPEQVPNPMSGCIETLPFLLVIVLIFWFMVIRPQKKQQVEQQRFLDRLKEGDRIITSSGIFGRIVTLDGEVAVIDVGDRTRIRFLRTQIARSQPNAVSSSESSSIEDGSSRGGKRKKKGS